MVFFYSYVCLVGGFNHLEKYEPVGMMTFPYIMENNPNVPNHQPVLLVYWISTTLKSTRPPLTPNVDETRPGGRCRGCPDICVVIGDG